MTDPIRDALVTARRAILIVGALLASGVLVALWIASADDEGQGAFVRLWSGVAYVALLVVIAGQWLRTRRRRRVSFSAHVEESRIDGHVVEHARELRASGLPWDAVCSVVEPRFAEWPEPVRARYREPLERAAG